MRDSLCSTIVERAMGKQLSMVEALMDPRLGANGKLARIDDLIDWTRLAPHAARIRGGEAGRPPYPPLSMLKALYLQALYDLSDPGLEEALLDRLSFRRFCGFAADQPTPDETTICRFRAAAAAAGARNRLFRRGEPPARCPGPDSAQRDAEGCDDRRRQARPAGQGGGNGGGPPEGTRRRLDQQERQVALRL